MEKQLKALLIRGSALVHWQSLIRGFRCLLFFRHLSAEYVDSCLLCQLYIYAFYSLHAAATRHFEFTFAFVLFAFSNISINSQRWTGSIDSTVCPVGLINLKLTLETLMFILNQGDSSFGLRLAGWKTNKERGEYNLCKNNES